MDRKRAAKIWPIIKAFSEGEDVEYRDILSVEWQKCSYPSFDCNPECYRIAPKKPRTGYLACDITRIPPHSKAVELTKEVREALEKAGIEIEE